MTLENYIYNKNSNTSAYQFTDHLGNVRAVAIKTPQNIVSLTHATDYYPFGMPMPNRQIVNGKPYRYAYQGQEKDPETGKEAFQLRLWDGRIGRWLTTDPAGQYASPYMGMDNRPNMSVDPDGGSTEENPVYGTNGKRRGSTKEGNDGEPIVTDGAFEGLTKDEVLDNGGFLIGDNFDYMNGDVGNKIMSDFMNLPNRVDFDGQVNLTELNQHAREGVGDLYVDERLIDLNPVHTRYFINTPIGKEKYVNFLNPHTYNHTTGLAYGTLAITLLDETTGSVRIGLPDRGYKYFLDEYNFEHDPRRSLGRNTATWIGRQYASYLGVKKISTFNIVGFGNNSKIRIWKGR